MKMTCAEIDVLLCDYVDGTLDAAARPQVEAHLAECADCAELARDSAAAVTFIGRVSEIEPPPALITRILQETPLQAKAPVRVKGWLGRWFGRWFEPVRQPRLVMGMAMTLLSFAMLGRFAGLEIRQLRPADLDPVKVWSAAENQAYRGWNRAVKYYDNLKLVYEIQSRLREWKEQDDSEADRTANPQPTGTAPAPGASPQMKERETP